MDSINSNVFYDFAKQYLNRGFSIIPLKLRDKRPAIDSWKEFQERRPTEKELDQWFGNGAKNNIGVVTGRISGITVIDFDSREAIKFAKDHGFPVTPMVKTGKGYHGYFGYKEGIRNFQKRDDLPGIDLRGDGGYVCCPPSIHENGHVYSWVPTRGLDDLPLAPLPEIILAKTPEEKTPLQELYRGVEKGTRNQSLVRLAGSWASDHLTFEECMANAAIWNSKNNPPLPEKDVERTVKSIFLKEKETLQILQEGIPSVTRLNLPLGGKVLRREAERLKDMAPDCPDTELRDKIIDILIARGVENKFKSAPLIRRRTAGLLLLQWLNSHGGFVQSEEGGLFYFYKSKRCLYELETERWAAWLYSLTGANPSGTDYSYLMTDCKTAAMLAPKRPILRLAYWSSQEQTLRVSRFDGTVYLLDGNSITEEPNGENILFNDNPLWQPATPRLDAPEGALRWLTTDLPKWEANSEMYGLALRAWIISMFFTELCPTKPLLVLFGEKGSGKSMLFRMIVKSLFGPAIDISGVPDKPDGFTAAAGGTHLLILDNLDEFTEWIRDKLARLATGAVDEYRRLYTSNEVGQVRYRCWLAFTARTPETLKRDDLADRLILLPMKRIEGSWGAEREFLNEAIKIRDSFWGDLLNSLNKIVASIREGKLETSSSLRLADWESLGRLIAKTENNENTWDLFVKKVESSQKNFLIEGDLIAEGLELWMTNPENHGKNLPTRELHGQLSSLLFGGKKQIPRDWPKTTKSFGRHLANIIEILKDFYEITITHDRTRTTFYQFEPKTDQRSAEYAERE